MSVQWNYERDQAPTPMLGKDFQGWVVTRQVQSDGEGARWLLTHACGLTRYLHGKTLRLYETTTRKPKKCECEK